MREIGCKRVAGQDQERLDVHGYTESGMDLSTRTNARD